MARAPAPGPQCHAQTGSSHSGGRSSRRGAATPPQTSWSGCPSCATVRAAGRLPGRGGPARPHQPEPGAQVRVGQPEPGGRSLQAQHRPRGERLAPAPARELDRGHRGAPGVRGLAVAGPDHVDLPPLTGEPVQRPACAQHLVVGVRGEDDRPRGAADTGHLGHRPPGAGRHRRRQRGARDPVPPVRLVRAVPLDRPHASTPSPASRSATCQPAEHGQVAVAVALADVDLQVGDVAGVRGVGDERSRAGGPPGLDEGDLDRGLDGRSRPHRRALRADVACRMPVDGAIRVAGVPSGRRLLRRGLVGPGRHVDERAPGGVLRGLDATHRRRQQVALVPGGRVEQLRRHPPRSAEPHGRDARRAPPEPVPVQVVARPADGDGGCLVEVDGAGVGACHAGTDPLRFAGRDGLRGRVDGEEAVAVVGVRRHQRVGAEPGPAAPRLAAGQRPAVRGAGGTQRGSRRVRGPDAPQAVAPLDGRGRVELGEDGHRVGVRLREAREDEVRRPERGQAPEPVHRATAAR